MIIYSIYCKLTGTYVTAKYNSGGKYLFYFGNSYGNTDSDRRRCEAICATRKSTKGKIWTDKNSVELLLDKLNSVMPDTFEIHTYNLEEKE